nr:hypothetical protein [Polyangiaceae bacterium]
CKRSARCSPIRVARTLKRRSIHSTRRGLYAPANQCVNAGDRIVTDLFNQSVRSLAAAASC